METTVGKAMDLLQSLLPTLSAHTCCPCCCHVGSGLMPFSRPLHTVVGAPVEFDPSAALKDNPEAGLDQLVDAYHAQYVAALKQLWNDHKDKYDSGRRKSLDIVE
jgi:hypothetical protein